MPVTLLDIVRNMSLVGWGIAIASLLVALLASIIYWQDTTRRSSKFFLSFSLLVAIWGAAFSYFEGALGTSAIYTAVSFHYLVTAGIPLSVLLYVYVFSTEKTTTYFWKFVAFIVLYLMIGDTLATTDLIARYDSMHNKLVPGPIYFAYVLYSLGFLVYGIINLTKKYRESTGVFKIAIRNFLVALSIFCTITALATLVLPLLSNGYSLFWVGHVAMIGLGFATAYIISEFNSWSIKVIATEFFISIIIVVLIAELFLATSVLDLFIKTVITLLIIFSSSFLVGSVRREIQSKERITNLHYNLGIMAKQLKVLDKKKSEFLSISSHHLRDPLTAIKGYSSMLTEGSFGELSPQIAEAVDKIFESSKRLITMISDFMDISRIESGDMNYKFTDVDLKKLVLDLEYEMKLNADKAHIGFSVTVDGPSGNESFVTVGDSGKLRQVISNLIDNSIKYTPRGEVTALLSKSADGKKVLFSVSDTGIGMSESTLDKIFRKFSRAEGVNKVYTEGTGLGLYVAKEIVKKHEGNIWAESKGEGLGSSFHVELEAKPI